jgi:hypothetical protein
VSFFEAGVGYVGAAADPSPPISASSSSLTSCMFVDDPHRATPRSMLDLPRCLTCVSFSLSGFNIGIWAGNFETAPG